VAAPLSARRKPVKANRGIAVRVGVSARRDISIKTTVRSTPPPKKEIRARAEMTTKRGVPRRARRTAAALITVSG
jgi:hypothetical protein